MSKLIKLSGITFTSTLTKLVNILTGAWTSTTWATGAGQWVVSSDGLYAYGLDVTGNVKKIVISTGATTTIVPFANLPSNLRELAISPDNSTIYGTTYVKTTGNTILHMNQVVSFPVSGSGVVTVIAGNSTDISVSTTTAQADGTGTAVQFVGPSGIAVDPTNTYLYVVDGVGTTAQTSSVLRKITIATGVVVTLPFSFGGGYSITQLAMGGSGNYLYYCDTPSQMQIKKLNLNTLASTTLYVPGASSTIAGLAPDAAETLLYVLVNAGALGAKQFLSINLSTLVRTNLSVFPGNTPTVNCPPVWANNAVWVSDSTSLYKSL